MSLPGLLKEIHHPCDRCGHPSKRYAVPVAGTARQPGNIYSGCRVAPSMPYGQRGRQSKAKQCWCDMYVPKPTIEDAAPGMLKDIREHGP